MSVTIFGFTFPSAEAALKYFGWEGDIEVIPAPEIKPEEQPLGWASSEGDIEVIRLGGVYGIRTLAWLRGEGLYTRWDVDGRGTIRLDGEDLHDLVFRQAITLDGEVITLLSQWEDGKWVNTHLYEDSVFSVIAEDEEGDDRKVVIVTTGGKILVSVFVAGEDNYDFELASAILSKANNP